MGGRTGWAAGRAVLVLAVWLAAAGVGSAQPPHGRSGGSGLYLGLLFGRPYPLGSVLYSEPNDPGRYGASSSYYGGADYQRYYSYGRDYYSWPGSSPGYRGPYGSGYDPAPPRGPKAVPPPAPFADVLPLRPTPKSLTEPASDSVLLTILVPADAEIWFDGVRTSQTGPVRQFVSPALVPGRRCIYEIVARWNDNGRPVERTETVAVFAGDRRTIDFGTSPAEAAADVEDAPSPRPIEP